MQGIPGNKYFQGDVEYATLINFYFNPIHHILGQVLLYGALQSNAIQGMVLSAQAIDRLIIDIFGKTCGVALSGPRAGWICVSSAGTFPSPFDNTFMLFTIGFIIVLLIVIPLGLTNLDSNMWVQYLSFVMSVILAVMWMSSSVVSGLDSSRIPVAVSDPVSYGSTVGTIMLNFAIITIIPSWVNIKSKDVNIQGTVWSSIIFIAVFYILTGLILALGFDKMAGVDNILTVLLEQGPLISNEISILTKLSVYMFAFVMLIPAIPVNLIISRENLSQNNVVPDRI